MPRRCLNWEKMEGIQLKARSTGITQKTLVFLIVGLIITNIAIVLAYRKCLNKELEKDLDTQISSSIGQYVALS